MSHRGMSCRMRVVVGVLALGVAAVTGCSGALDDADDYGMAPTPTHLAVRPIAVDA